MQYEKHSFELCHSFYYLILNLITRYDLLLVYCLSVGITLRFSCQSAATATGASQAREGVCDELEFLRNSSSLLSSFQCITST